jgi:hypothetical protein
MDDLKLVSTKLKGFRKEWTSFFKGIVEHEKILDWSRIWDEFVLEELQDEYLMEVSTRMTMRMLLFSAKKRRERSRNFPMESMPLKTIRRRTRAKSSSMHVTSLGSMQVNVQTRRRVEMRHNQR